ncbi:uncharacterized protein LOC122274337 [Carya illinoinensis]|uniref:Uncharacterized protein n=1 Tax=Carya illinoinensis TaxID=32201 RepID=A0A8T1PTJ3_CARIL|nr:uncharacterized protein LOC122274337 [Carya illinoinensis]KAG6645003.1 hypothetical protein CIPAW_08G091500 [Carya illinoinensis]KAG6700055.1 hypothetical protein I3842_08G092300 [Carya illinoinensis]
MSHNLVSVLVLGTKFPTYLCSLSSAMDLLQSPSNGGIPQDAFEPHNLLVSFADTNSYSDDFESTCSTPYVSAPSSPGRGYTSNHCGYFFSAPASPMHYVISSAPSTTCPSTQPLDTSSFEFESRFSPNGSVAVGSMSSADELFLNGQIRPMKLSSHLQRPQILAPLLDLDEDEELEEERDKATLKLEHSDTVLRRGRDLKLRSRSLNRKARSLSPIRNAQFQALQQEEEDDEDKTKRVDDLILNFQEDFAGAKQRETTTVSTETTPSPSASSSRSSSTGRNSKKWIFLKELLYRSKSEGRGGNSREKFWSSISSLAPSSKEKPPPPAPKEKKAEKQKRSSKQAGRPTNGVAAAKRRVPAPSPHELHYTAYRAQAEELKKRTFLPYRQGLLGCLGLSFKGYGAFNGLGRDLNPVSSG